MRLEVKISVDRTDATQIFEAPNDASRAVIDTAVSSLIIERVPGPKRIRPEMSERIGGYFGDRFPRWLAFTLLGLFAVQYALPGQGARYLLCAIYGGIALVALIRNRRYILPALTAPFRALPSPSREPAPATAIALGPRIERIEQVDQHDQDDEDDWLSDRPADASAAAAGYSPPRTRS